MQNIGNLPFEAPLADSVEPANQKNGGPIGILLEKLSHIIKYKESLRVLSLLALKQQNHISVNLFNKTIFELKNKFANIMYYVPIDHKNHQQKLIEFLVDEELLPSHELMFAGRSLFDGLNVTTVFDALELPFYTTRPDGSLDCYSAAAATLWGWNPPIGQAKWCGSWKLLTEEGSVLAHRESPMAMCIQKQKPVRHKNVIGERPDGSRYAFRPFPSPLVNRAGDCVGAISALVDISAFLPAEP